MTSQDKLIVESNFVDALALAPLLLKIYNSLQGNMVIQSDLIFLRGNVKKVIVFIGITNGGGRGLVPNHNFLSKSYLFFGW